MSATNRLVAFVLGAGSNVGSSVAAKLKENGYRVALGSRSAKNEEDQGYLNVKVDVTRRESIESAFDVVAEKLGPVNVVVYNAASLNIPPVENDILSIPVSTYEESVSLALGVFTAAQKAVPGFRSEVHRNHPKTFIVTGNILPFNQYSPPKWFTLGVQKTIEARFIATAAKSYEAENFQFYYATLVSNTGEIPGSIFWTSGPVIADVYWQLINNKKQASWDHRFTPDGKTYKASSP
ncbi:hypothetical protein CVT26_013872 [Gymnopilus dilepis]|uniref:NAD(P)-binding domain-containing protein n=1 Tax=Gymnopilus dilepis TaxID=231916 RepID=A0A409Y699_9AGAR|nr:hypothetical protein CVT26_013872 [Gymnopilus dilepis]